MGYNNTTDSHSLWIDPVDHGEVASPDLTVTEAVTRAIPNGFFIRQSTTWGAGLAAWTAWTT
jgi:hypothetical protein